MRGDTLGMAYMLTDLDEAHARLGAAENAYPLLIEAAELAQQANNAHVQSCARQALAEIVRASTPTPLTRRSHPVPTANTDSASDPLPRAAPDVSHCCPRRLRERPEPVTVDGPGTP